MSFDLNFSKVLEELVIGGKQMFPFYNIARKMKRGEELPQSSGGLFSYEPTDTFKISIALAGYRKDQIDVSTSKGVLTVRSSKDTDSQHPGASQYTWCDLEKGLTSGSFSRKFRLPRHAVVNSVHFENGLLEIEVEIKTPETEKPVKYEIN